MITRFIILLITFYQKFISPLLLQLIGQRQLCRYSPTCSKYAKDAISRHGVIGGSLLAVKRILHCQPFTKQYATI